jgi:hypothetical protein
VAVDNLTLVLALVLLLCSVLLGYLAIRWVQLMRGGGVDVSLRRRLVGSAPGASGAGWQLGVGRYRGDELCWYRLTSLWPGPTLVIDRTALEIVDRRPRGPGEGYAIPQADVVLRCRTGAADVEVAMAPGVLTGFQSWLEATPPGRSTGYRQAS